MIQLAMVALVIAFPELVGHHATAASGGVIDIPMESDGYGDYFLPREWR